MVVRTYYYCEPILCGCPWGAFFFFFFLHSARMWTIRYPGHDHQSLAFSLHTQTYVCRNWNEFCYVWRAIRARLQAIGDRELFISVSVCPPFALLAIIDSWCHIKRGIYYSSAVLSDGSLDVFVPPTTRYGKRSSFNSSLPTCRIWLPEIKDRPRAQLRAFLVFG